MKTYFFFRFESHTSPPVIKTFSINFEDNGAQIHDANQPLHGVYILEPGCRIIERTNGEQKEIPVVQSLLDDTQWIFDDPVGDCVASANPHIISAFAYFFRHGFNTALEATHQRIREIQEANPTYPRKPKGTEP